MRVRKDVERILDIVKRLYLYLESKTSQSLEVYIEKVKRPTDSYLWTFYLPKMTEKFYQEVLSIEVDLYHMEFQKVTLNNTKRHVVIHEASLSVMVKDHLGKDGVFVEIEVPKDITHYCAYDLALGTLMNLLPMGVVEEIVSFVFRKEE